MTQDATKTPHKQTLVESVHAAPAKKGLPNSPESEQCVLAYLIMHPDKIISMSGDIDKKDFYNTQNQTVYGVLCAMASDNKHIDLATICSHLEETDQMKMAGGYSRVSEILGGIPKMTKVEPHVEIIKEKARLRKLIRSTYDAFQSCYVPGAKPKDIASKLTVEVNPLATGRDSEPNRILSRDVKDWVKGSAGEFCRLDVRNDLNLVSTQDRHNLTVILNRLEKEGMIVRSGKREGHYRRVESDLAPMDWENADLTEVPMLWPLDIHEFFSTFKRTIAVIAGVKSEGKTAFCMDTARLNVDNLKVRYFTNELGPQLVKVRTAKFKSVPIDVWKKIEFFDRTENFEDMLLVDGLNIIDYLETKADSFYMVGEHIRRIQRKLNDGVALIAIQKGQGKMYGDGGHFSADAAHLYLTLDSQKCKILHAKNIRDEWEDSMDGKVRKIKINKGAELVAEGPWESPNYEQGSPSPGGTKMRF